MVSSWNTKEHAEHLCPYEACCVVEFIAPVADTNPKCPGCGFRSPFTAEKEMNKK